MGGIGTILRAKANASLPSRKALLWLWKSLESTAKKRRRVKSARRIVQKSPTECWDLQPVLTFTIGLYQKPKHYADQDEAIGETIGGAKQEGVQERQIGNAQAWYYPDEKTLILWECFLAEFVRDTPLLNDPNMKQLWTGFEEWLLKQFPQAVTIATLFSDPLFPTQ